MSSQAPPNPWFSGINYNSQFFDTNTTGVSLSYINANFLKITAGSTPISNASLTTFANAVVFGNSTLSQTGVNLDIRNNSVASTMTVRLNNGASAAQTVMSLNGLGNNTSVFNGNSTTSTTASNVAVSDVSAFTGDFNLLMSAGSSSSTLGVKGTSSLLYDPSTGVLKTPALSVAGTLTLSSAATAINASTATAINFPAASVTVNKLILPASITTTTVNTGTSWNTLGFTCTLQLALAAHTSGGANVRSLFFGTLPIGVYSCTGSVFILPSTALAVTNSYIYFSDSTNGPTIPGPFSLSYVIVSAPITYTTAVYSGFNDSFTLVLSAATTVYFNSWFLFTGTTQSMAQATITRIG